MPKQQMNRVVGLERCVTERVIQAREMRGLNKVELAERLGLKGSGYSPYENFKIPFTLAMLERLVRVLDMPLEWFLGIEGRLEDDEHYLLSMYRRSKEQCRDRLVLDTLKILTREDNA